MSSHWFHKSRDHRACRRLQDRRRRLLVEPLEGRQLLTTLLVTTAADSGAGSLRQAIITANGNTTTTPDIIDFKIPGSGVQSINLASALPTISKPVTLDGTSQPGYAGLPLIVLNGANAGSSAVGLSLTSGASGSTLKGLAVDSFAGGGVQINGGSKDRIAQDDIGVNAAGTTAEPNGGFGVLLEGKATHVTVYDNVISGNNGNGVEITGSGTNANLVAGNFIGTDSTGSHAVPNVDGVVIQSGASKNTIGGTSTASRNVISGNSWDGVHIVNSGTTGNVVEGNYIGVTASGSAGLGNGASGVAVFAVASNNVIGGTATGCANVISSSGVYGVYISDAGTTGNLVEGNDIGTDASGLHALGNGSVGVYIQAGASSNTVGGSTAGAANLISGNAGSGVRITGTGTSNNLVEGNDVGTFAGGGGPLANGGYGAQVDSGASSNTVGGTTVGTRNVISGNGASGVQIAGSGTTGNVVEGNYIGVDSTGEFRVGNAVDGVDIGGGASSNVIGGTTTSARNIISANAYEGVWITGSGTSLNLVEGNYIGTDFSGTSALGNAINGIQVDSGASDDTIGGTTVADGNLIDYNGQNGVGIGGPAFAITIEFDIIDLNGANGVWFAGASGNTGVFCTIEANGQWGILDQGSGNYYAYNTLANNLAGNVGT
jgi:titin